jgi:hypothetical protein
MKPAVALKNVNKYHKDSLSRSQRFASWITGKIGTMTFFMSFFPDNKLAVVEFAGSKNHAV